MEMNDAKFHFMEFKTINGRMNTKFFYNGRNSVSREYYPHTEQQRPLHQPDVSSSNTVCVFPRGAVTLLSPGYTRDWFMFRFEVVEQQNNTEKSSGVFGSSFCFVFSMLFVPFCLEIGYGSLSLCIISVLDFMCTGKMLRGEHTKKHNPIIHG